jgi:hypothetical protein
LTAPFAMPSARVLRDAIEQISGKHYLLTSRNGIARRALARYGGTTTVVPGGQDTDNNSIERIRVVGNKLTFADLLFQNSVKTVTFFGGSNRPSSYPVLVRETLTSYGGRGIHVCRTAEEFNTVWQPGYKWTPFLPFSNEYRVHVMGGQVVRVFEKVREDGLPEEDLPIRNAHRGYHFSIRNRPLHGQSIRSIVEQVAKIPLLATGFYALDLGWVKGENGGMYVIEGNSTPGIDMPTALYYARYILTGNPFEGEQKQKTTEEVQPATPASVTVARIEVDDTDEPDELAEFNWNTLEPELERQNPADEIVLPTRGVERREDESEVLRPTPNTSRNDVPKASDKAGGEHKPVVSRPKWSW